MPLEVPKHDERTFTQILNETLARIPVHNPEWTNFNSSDPGVTLLQLFAFMSESLLYRSSLIPDRNRIKFLKLLGVPLHPASSAECMVSFSNERGPLEPIVLPDGIEVTAGKVPFRTTRGLAILPLEAQVYYKRPVVGERETALKAEFGELYESFFPAEGITLGFYETAPVELPINNNALPSVDLTQDTRDGSLWIALLARKPETVEETREAIATRTLSLGILPSLAESPRVVRPGGPENEESQVVLRYFMPDVPEGGFLPPEPENRIARYFEVEAHGETNILERAGVVELRMPELKKITLWSNLDPTEAGSGNFPPALEDTNVQDRLVTWIRVQLPGFKEGEDKTANLQARISWLGVNTVPVIQRAHIPNEELGRGSGEPDQSFRLTNTPVNISEPDRLRITIDGELWEMIDELYAAGPEVPALATPAQQNSAGPLPVKVYQVDPESGEVRFGDGLHGARPPRGAVIRASYDYGGGLAGMVGIGAINKGPLLPAGVKVYNYIPAWGGDEPESVDTAEKRIPQFLRHRNRLISREDFKDVTQQTPGVDIGRVEILPTFNPEIPRAITPGVVTVMVIPKYDPLYPEAPQPDQLFLGTICDYLESRRLVTTELHVRGPQYIDIHIAIGIEAVAGISFEQVRKDVDNSIRTYLSPLKGGREGTGWPLGKPVVDLEILAEVARVSGVSLVNQVRLSSGGEKSQVPLEGLELPRIASLSVTLGQAEEPGAGGLQPPLEGEKIFPVPVVPERC